MTNLTSTIFKHDGSDQAKECIKIINEVFDQCLTGRSYLYYGFDDTGELQAMTKHCKEITLYTLLTPSEFLAKLKEEVG